MLRAIGSLLLALAGAGGGWAAAARLAKRQQQAHSFARLLGYLADLLEAQALAGPELLYRAARCTAFAPFCPAGVEALSQLALPPSLPRTLQGELCSALAAAEESPRQTACAALRRLSALCEEEAAVQAAHCRKARQLWPRLGGCLGAMAAILLW